MAHCHFQEDMMRLRQINRQMRLLDVRLQLLRERLCACRPLRLSLPCCCLTPPCYRPLIRRALTARMDTDRRSERRKRLCMLLNSTCCPSNLACLDMKGFEPKDVSVMVRDGRVTVAAERKDEHHTCLGKASNYKKFVKEFSLPPGVCDHEVTYTVESSSLCELPKCCLTKCCSPTCCSPTCCSPTCCSPICCSPTCCSPTCCSPTCCSPKCCTTKCCTTKCCSPKCCSSKCCSYICDC